METAFLKIGGALGLGGAFGCANGLMLGLKETKALNLSGGIRRSQ